MVVGDIADDRGRQVVEAIRGQGGDAILAKTPLGRFGRPDDIAYCVLYLASDESSSQRAQSSS